jgi:hypothetical protein
MSDKERVSFNPDNVSSGGFIDDIVVEFTNCRTEVTDYEGRAQTAVPCFIADLKDPEADADAEGAVQIAYWKAGDPEAWDTDGEGFIPIGKPEKLNEKAKFIEFVQSCVSSGFDAEKVGNDVTIFEGMVAHVIDIETVYDDLKDEETGESVKVHNIIVDRIETFPYKDSKKAAKGKGKDKAKAKVKKDDGGDKILEKAVDFVTDLLTAEDALEDGYPKKELPKKCFTIMKGDKDAKAIVKFLYSDDFLGDEERPWSYEDGIVSIA